MLKLIAQNKYKLMAFIIGLYLLTDVLQHKGQTRILFPKTFPAYTTAAGMPKSKSMLINKDKEWKKGINTAALIGQLDETAGGFEADVYFDTATNSFAVHHDAGKQTGQYLDGLLDIYRQKKLTAGIWLDLKNLDESNAAAALASLLTLQKKYALQNKLLVESGRAELLTAFSDSGFYTSYYTPMFNPYQLSDEEIKQQAERINAAIKNARVNALSGYYFQYPFLKHYFPGYPVLTWAEKKPLSLVNRLFRMKLSGDQAIFIALYP